MNNQTKDLTDAKALKSFLNSLPRGEYALHRAAIQQASMEGMPKFTSWLYGRSRIPNSAKYLMNTYTLEKYGREIFDLSKLSV